MSVFDSFLSVDLFWLIVEGLGRLGRRRYDGFLQFLLGVVGVLFYIAGFFLVVPLFVFDALDYYFHEF